VDLSYARKVIDAEAKAVSGLKRTINDDFHEAAELILSRNAGNGGRVVGTGMGKAGIIAQKVCASLASTGTPALFMHPTEAVHGDLGMVAKNDILLVFSNSGESEEIVRLLPCIRKTGGVVIALTERKTSSLGKNADVVLELGKIVEPCPLKLAPTASTTAMLALGDALALCVLKARSFTERDYARLHPGGALGRKLLEVSELMRTGERLPLIRPDSSVGEALNRMSQARGGAAVVVDKRKHLIGIFTDGDFRRLMLDDPGHFNDPVRAYMTSPCKSILDTTLVSAAQEQMGKMRVNALPVVDARKKVRGLLDIQDLVVW
jgi:arabinose-5-phosphate isomerase